MTKLLFRGKEDLKGERYFKYINPLYYIRKKNSLLLEKKEWGILEENGVDFITAVDSGRDHYSKYQITRPQHISFIKEFFLERGIEEKDAIIDIGCGKGGMLYLFSKYNFGKIAGLEYSEELCSVCEKNMAYLGISAEIINQDASTYDNYDDYNLFYLYNPFQQKIMNKFVANLNNSLKRNKRYVNIIYSNPVYINEFLNNGFIIKREFATNIMFKERAVILENADNGDTI